MRVATLKAGLKVFCVSQFGDLPFILGLASIGSAFESSDLSVILSTFCVFTHTFFFAISSFVNVLSYWSGLMLFALFLKAAQFFFYP